jgi:hypothetical protein
MSEALLRVLIDSSVRVVFLAALAAAALALFRVRHVGLQHAVWTSVLCAMLVMPLLPLALPAIELPLPQPVVATPAQGPTAFPSLSVLSGEARLANPSAPGSPAAAPQRRQTLSSGEVGSATDPGPEPTTILLWTYSAVTALLLFRFGFGWRGANRVRRASRPVDGILRESTAIATPVSMGLWRPVILLPAQWQDWSQEARRAVLAHERTHVARRDPLIAFLAGFNRCLFWFHPLAWWLERRLGVGAEHVCDAAGASAIGADRYAQILVEMAERVRKSGGRLLLHGVGIHDPDSLGRRIDRVLAGSSAARPSSLQKAGVAAVSALAIFVVAACQRSAPAPTPLRDARHSPDPWRERQEAESRFLGDAWALDDGEVAALETSLEDNPDDLASRKKLLAHYAAALCEEDADVPALRLARRSHILWTIEHHPESSLAGATQTRFFAHPSGPSDAPGYRRARELWLNHVNRAGASPEILTNASRFFETADKPLAEEMLLRARGRDPGGPWSIRLGRFYAVVLAGNDARLSAHHSTPLSLAEPGAPYTEAVREKLAQSPDDVLLLAAAEHLLLRGSPGMRLVDGKAVVQPFDRDAAARPYVQRAVMLNPESLSARVHLENLRWHERSARHWALMQEVPLEAVADTVLALPEPERFAVLADAGLSAYERSVAAPVDQDPNLDDYVRLAREQSRILAQEILALAPRFREHPRHGPSVHYAHVILGSLACLDDDVSTAAEHLRRATQVQPTDELTYAQKLPARALLLELLRAGERKPVVSFLEWNAQISLPRRTELREAVASIQQGEMPQLRWPSVGLWVSEAPL